MIGVANDMPDGSSLRTRADVMDLVIGFLVEHEKRLDMLVERLERITKEASLDYMKPKTTSALNKNIKTRTFNLTITNPTSRDRIKSVKIEFETSGEFNGDMSDIDNLLDKIEFDARRD